MDERQHPRDGSERIGEILLRAELLRREQLREALELQRTRGGRLGHILVDQGYVDQEDFARAFSRQLRMPLLSLEGYVLDPEVGRLLPRGSLEHHRILPLQVRDGRVTLAMADPFNEFAVQELRRATGFAVKPVLATTSDILSGVARLFQDLGSRAHLLDTLRALRERDTGAIAAGQDDADLVEAV